ncbi:MAG: DUF2141 domain-containing protein [Myxococcota bacterium]
MITLLMGSALAFDVIVTDIEGPGTIGCAAFRVENGFPGDPTQAIALDQVKASAAVDGKVTCRFPKLTEGKIGVAVRHDRNENGKLDSNLVGFPKEPFGFSRNAPLRTFGPPKFEDVLVDVTASPITIRLVKP